MIKNVIFDIGNVLVDFRWRVLMEDLKLPRETQAIFENTVFGSRWWGELDHGIYEESEILKNFREDNKEHLDEFNLVWDHRDKLVEPYAYAVQWIKQLKASGLKVYLLSNYPKDIFTLHTECGCFPFLDQVDGKVVSGFVRMIKPNADIYEYLLKEYGLEAAESVFIDDREENIETARGLGMKGIVFQSYEQACGELDRLIAEEGKDCIKDYVKLWDDYSIKFNKTLEFDFGGDWNQLDQEEREIAALWKLLVDGYNGGFEQFFCNWGYPGYWYAMCGLQKIEDWELLEQLHNTYEQVFEKFRDDSRLQSYWDIPQYFTKEDEAILDETNQYFWGEAGENFAKLAYEYYHDQIQKQPRINSGK